jgi:predicted enzyme related to lactoylglutathione lyase
MIEPKQSVGTVSWIDLTVPDAERIGAFYNAVVGWKVTPFDMSGYRDFCVESTDGKTVAGICHARGENVDLPAQWLIYIVVRDLEESIQQCKALGGKVLSGPRESAEGRFVVIEDPAGAVAALFERSLKNTPG